MPFTAVFKHGIHALVQIIVGVRVGGDGARSVRRADCGEAFQFVVAGGDGKRGHAATGRGETADEAGVREITVGARVRPGNHRRQARGTVVGVTDPEGRAAGGGGKRSAWAGVSPTRLQKIDRYNIHNPTIAALND